MRCDWLAPLAKRTKKTSYVQNNIILRISGFVIPVFAYTFLNQTITIVFAYMIGTGQYGTVVSSFFSEHSLFCAAVIRIMSVILAVLPLTLIFHAEYPIIWHTWNDGFSEENVAERDKSSDDLIERVKWIICIILLSASSALFFNALAISTGFSGSSQSFSQTSSNQFSLPVWLGIIVYGLVTPITEEIVHRGIVYNRARKYYSTMLAMVISSFLFGFSHGNVVQLVYGFIMGMLICYIYERFGAFVYPVMFHCIANSVVYVALSNPVLKEIAISVPGMIAEVAVMAGTGVLVGKLKNIDTQ